MLKPTKGARVINDKENICVANNSHIQHDIDNRILCVTPKKNHIHLDIFPYH